MPSEGHVYLVGCNVPTGVNTCQPRSEGSGGDGNIFRLSDPTMSPLGRLRKPAGCNASEPTCSLVNSNRGEGDPVFERGSQYLGTLGQDSPETPPGYQGRHAGTEDVSTGETLADQIASDIRWYRSSGVFARESDGAIVLLITATT